MKKVIVNNDKIRVTANGQSIVEGSFARVTEIRGKSVKCENLIPRLTPKEETKNGASIKIYDNNSVALSGTSTQTYSYFNAGTFTLEAGTYYISGIPNGITEDKATMYLQLPNDRFVFANREFTLDTTTSVMMFFRVGNLGSSIILYPMLNKGNKPLPYQPYFEGIKHSKIKGILSHNRNLLSNSQSNAISSYMGEAYFSQDLIDLINSKNVNSLTMSSNFKSNKIIWQKENSPRLFVYLADRYSDYYTYFDTFFPIYNKITQKRQLTAQLDKSKTYSYGSAYFNYFEKEPIGAKQTGAYISTQNQLEIGNSPTRFVENETYEYFLPNEITLRSYVGEEEKYKNVRDVYFPETGLIIRCVDEYGQILDTPIYEEKSTELPEILFNGYKAFNNGFEKLISSVDSNGLTPYDYGAIPEIVVEYEVEPKQGADRTRFDFITLDGEAICGIGYEKLKSTNQLQYVEEPDRQGDGSMQNIEDYDTFILPALEVGFNCINEETYRRLKHKLISKRTFDVGYYDKDLDKVVTMEMYVKPIDLDNFLSYGDDIIGMNFSISFVPTLNEETLFSVTFLNSDYNTIIKEYSGNNGVLYGRAITTPALPSDYKYWLMIESGFKENTFVKIKGNKKLSIFGNTKLIAVK